MLWVGVFVLLGLLPAYVQVAGQLMVATAKCLPGYTWVCLIDCWITSLDNMQPFFRLSTR